MSTAWPDRRSDSSLDRSGLTEGVGEDLGELEELEELLEQEEALE